MMSFILWYLTLSYVVGFALFSYEVIRAIKNDRYELLGFGIILLFLSPLTAWHGVLHYLAVLWHHVNGTPFKPWI